MARKTHSRTTKVTEGTHEISKRNTELDTFKHHTLLITEHIFENNIYRLCISTDSLENSLFESDVREDVREYAVVVFHNTWNEKRIAQAKNIITGEQIITNENTFILLHGSVQSLKNIETTKSDVEKLYREQGTQVAALKMYLHLEIVLSLKDIQEIITILDSFSSTKNVGKNKAQTSLNNDLELFPTKTLASIFHIEWKSKPENFLIQNEQFQEAIFTVLEQLCLQTRELPQGRTKRKRYKHKEFDEPLKVATKKKTTSVDSPKNPKVENRHVAIHLEKSQFGRTQPDPMSIMTVIHDTEVLQKAQENNIELIGIDPSWNGFKAIAALQKALTRQGYKPEPEYIEVVDDEEIATSQGMLVQRIVKRVPNPMYNDEINSIRRAFKYQDGLPRLIYKTWTEYYEDFGVPKYETERGKIEYNGKIKLEAEEALAALVKNAFVWNYIRVRNPKTPKEVREDVTAYAPLIAAVQVVRNEITKELEYIEIIPSPVIVDQVSTHFLIYPSNLEDQVFRALNAKGKGRPPRYQLLFVKWLYLRAKENNLRPFSNTYRELGRILRMDAWIDTRQDKRVRDSLEKCFVVALNLNLVEKIDRNNDKFTFYLNPEKFRRKTPKELESNLNENVNT